MRFSYLVLLCFAVLSTSAHGQDPHRAELKTPQRDETAGILMMVPTGYRLCGEVGGNSTQKWYYVPLDKAVRCEQLPELVDWDRMPDFIVIGPYSGAALLYERTSDIVADEPFFCQGKSYGLEQRPISGAPTSVTPAGHVLAGLETTSCTRDDIGGDLHTKAYLAYRPRPNFFGYGYMIGAHVRMANKAKADKLLESIVGKFKLLDAWNRQ